MSSPQTYHASSVVMDDRAILLRGPSGAGKSDLALRLLAMGGRLLADDQTILEARDKVVWASTPPSIAGLMEVRGLGVVSTPDAVPVGQMFPVALVVDLVVDPKNIERLPDVTECQLLDVPCPWLAVYGFAASAPQVIRVGLDVVLGRRTVTR